MFARGEMSDDCKRTRGASACLSNTARLESGGDGRACRSPYDLYRTVGTWRKNATIESISKVAAALNISLSKLFENISLASSEKDIPSRCYDLIQKQPLRDQKLLLDILDAVIAYKKQ